MKVKAQFSGGDTKITWPFKVYVEPGDSLEGELARQWQRTHPESPPMHVDQDMALERSYIELAVAISSLQKEEGENQGQMRLDFEELHRRESHAKTHFKLCEECGLPETVDGMEEWLTNWAEANWEGKWHEVH